LIYQENFLGASAYAVVIGATLLARAYRLRSHKPVDPHGAPAQGRPQPRPGAR
jgi:hypothetical protein